MDRITALHTAARRYCIDRIRYWQDIWRLSQDSRDTPHLPSRIRLLQAILRDVEAFEPADFSTIPELQDLLLIAAISATDEFIRKEKDPPALAAIADERSLFKAFLNALNLATLAPAPLPYRKVLTESQHRQLHQQFTSRWTAWYGGVPGRTVQHPHITLFIAAMDSPGAYQLLAHALASRGITRLYELRESGDGFHLDLELVSFQYNGAEGFWTSGDMSWMVYASHEASITFGGDWLIDLMRAALPHFDHWLYKGYDASTYGPPPPTLPPPTNNP